MAEHIFEPFYTSNPRGTGLGLFIARELCECNRARLSYEPRPRGGSCFRIVFGAAEGWLT
jgi:two-component system sensor histidine kinase PilS (NtrC family)